ncbi:pyridoxal phosphate-dependent aminotransferase, partial [Streptomyces sp. NPDC127079]
PRGGAPPARRVRPGGGVAVNSGIPVGTGGAGRVRLNLATSPEVLTEAVHRMATALGRTPAPP